MIDRSKFKATSIFLILQEIIDRELTDIETFINEIDFDLSQKQKKLEHELKSAMADKISDDDFNEYFETDYHKLFNVLPFYSFNPTLLMVYGFLENWLKKLCDQHHNRKFSEIRVNDLAGTNYIEKSKRYLTLVAELDFTQIDEEWRYINQVQKLRNHIAHQRSSVIKDSQLPLEKQELYGFIFNEKRIELDKEVGTFYIKDKSFLIDFIAIVRKCFSHLISQLIRPSVRARNTTMPHDNTLWGQEKTEQLLAMIISGLEMLDQNEKRTDEWKDSDLKFNLRGVFASMSWNLTKLYSFFCDGNWTTEDSNVIVNKRKEGLVELKKAYGAINPDDTNFPNIKLTGDNF